MILMSDNLAVLSEEAKLAAMLSPKKGDIWIGLAKSKGKGRPRRTSTRAIISQKDTKVTLLKDGHQITQPIREFCLWADRPTTRLYVEEKTPEPEFGVAR